MVAHALYLISPRIVTAATPLTSDELKDPLPVRAKYSSPIGRLTPFIHWRPHAVGAQQPLSAGAGLLELESFVLSYARFSEEALDIHPAGSCLNVRATERLLLAAARFWILSTPILTLQYLMSPSSSPTTPTTIQHCLSKSLTLISWTYSLL